MPPRYTREAAEEAVAASKSYAETLRRLGMCDRGGSWKILEKYVALWGISVDHFDPHAANVVSGSRRATPLEELLVVGTTIGSSKLKERLYRAGLKERTCELCGQGEEWGGRRMSLILDHVNGVRDDNRLENLRIVCPNCNATLDTHCGRNVPAAERVCIRCGSPYRPTRRRQRFCTQRCWAESVRGTANLGARRVERPPYEQLLAEVRALGWVGTGRKYGVSDNAIRKWVRASELARGRAGPEGEAA